ncbi:MAG: ABC transporter substrate-binding protein, partial [Deltaproteobacteria bacterium]
MCDNRGRNYQNIMKASRRGFLKSSALAAAALAMPSSLASVIGSGVAEAAGMTTLKATHGAGLCNLGIFLAKERNLAAEDNVELDFVVTPTTTDVVTLFGAGMVDISVIPYSNFITLVDQGAPVKAGQGSGAGGGQQSALMFCSRAILEGVWP